MPLPIFVVDTYVHICLNICLPSVVAVHIIASQRRAFDFFTFFPYVLTEEKSNVYLGGARQDHAMNLGPDLNSCTSAFRA